MFIEKVKKIRSVLSTLKFPSRPEQ